MRIGTIFAFVILFSLAACKQKQNSLEFLSFQSTRSGQKFERVQALNSAKNEFTLKVDSTVSYQEIIGFGGAFTEASAHLLMNMSESKRDEIIDLYFSTEKANYSLMRTHMNSCDFSLSSYAYDTTANDTALTNFSISRDKNELIPIIQMAADASQHGFKLFSSPWTAPPWMKTNQDWFGGELKKEYYQTWADYFVKYIEAYKNEGIEICGLTVENEPMGNNSNWESMHFTPQSMADFVKNHLGPTLKKNNLQQEIFVFDQNKGEELEKWAEVLLKDEGLKAYISGTAVHWYESTVSAFVESLQKTHQLAPEMQIIHSEACIDAEKPVWKNDDWYWQKKATDWGWDWAPDHKKKDHPIYAPVHRYANDIIDCMNNHVSAWVDWNIVLNKEGGPNHVKNWCIAPIIVDDSLDEYYTTPLYYIMRHFSQYVRPGAKRIEWSIDNEQLKCTAFQNPNGTIVLVIFNPEGTAMNGQLNVNGVEQSIKIEGEAIQTIVVQKREI